MRVTAIAGFTVFSIIYKTLHIGPLTIIMTVYINKSRETIFRNKQT